jgi:large conductance mechanosensitive channel
MLKGFRDFILRGNVLDLAVAVIIGAAFTAIVNSFVKDIVTPFIAAIVAKPDFSALVLNVHGGVITYGNFLNAVISFLLMASVVYFLIIVPTNALMARFSKPAPAEAPAIKTCPQCLSEVPLAATRCKFCAQAI